MYGPIIADFSPLGKPKFRGRANGRQKYLAGALCLDPPTVPCYNAAMSTTVTPPQAEAENFSLPIDRRLRCLWGLLLLRANLFVFPVGTVIIGFVYLNYAAEVEGTLTALICCAFLSVCSAVALWQQFSFWRAHRRADYLYATREGYYEFIQLLEGMDIPSVATVVPWSKGDRMLRLGHTVFLWSSMAPVLCLRGGREELRRLRALRRAALRGERACYSRAEREAFFRYIEECLGPVARVYKNDDASSPCRELLLLAPAEDVPFYTLCTLGLGAHFMCPLEEETPLYMPWVTRTELMMYLPADREPGEELPPEAHTLLFSAENLASMPVVSVTSECVCTFPPNPMFPQAGPFHCLFLDPLPVCADEEANLVSICPLSQGPSISFLQVLPISAEELELNRPGTSLRCSDWQDFISRRLQGTAPLSEIIRTEENRSA